MSATGAALTNWSNDGRVDARRCQPGARLDDELWRTSRHSLHACVQAKALGLVVRNGVVLIDEATPLAVPSRVGSPPVQEESRQPRAPWYVEHGMLGELTVAGLLRWTSEEAALAARAAVAGFDGEFADLAVADLVEAKIAALLASNEPAVWDRRLERGEMHVTGEHLVWIRPELVEPRPAEEVDVTALRRYDVRFATTTSALESSRTVSSGLDALFFTAFNLASGAASAQGVGVPLLAADGSASSSRTATTTVITGRKLFVERSSRFLSGVRFRVFVDGIELSGTPGAVARGVAVDLPAIFSSAAEPRAVLTSPTQVVTGQDTFARPLSGDEVLHAVDLTPVVAQEQARLRRAGLGPELTRSIVAQVQDVLNERNARNNSRWWLTTGSVSRGITAGADTPLLRRLTSRFSGHFRVVATLESIQRLGTTDAVPMRTDLGGARAVALGEGGSSAAAMTVALNTTGLTGSLPDPSTVAIRTSGVAPLLGVTVSRSREWSHRLTSQPATHSVLNATAPQARYRSVLAIKVIWESSSIAALTRRPSVTTRTNGDIGVPELGTHGAAAFEERLLGPRAGKDTPPTGAAVVVPTEAAGSAGPHLQVLPQETETLRHTVSVRPATLHPDYRPRRGRREPLALASRMGLGFAVGSSLPGSELVAEHFRTRLEQLVTERGIRGVDWAAVHRDLLVNFGTPRLEGDMNGVLAGIKHTLRVGDRQVSLFVRLHLTDTVDVTDYPGVINTRAAVGESVVGGVSKQWTAQGTVGGALRVTVPWVRVQAGAVRMIGRFFRGHGDHFGVGTETYRRVESIGREDEHTIDAVYESSVHVVDDRRLRPERWWTLDPTNVVAKIVVPGQHVPAEPVRADVALRTGLLTQATRAWPEGHRLDLTAGTAGLFPVFLTLPVLARTTAGLYARLHGLPPAWAQSEVCWPTEILDLADPTWHAARLGMLAGERGFTAELPDRDGWRTTVTVRLRAYAPRELATTGETEIEQYSKTTQHHAREREHGHAVGVQVALGPQVRLGSDAPQDIESVGDDDFGRDTVTSRQGPGGRAALLAHGGAEQSWTRTANQKTGFLDITRATYSGPKTALRVDPVYQVTVTRARGERPDVEHARRYLRFDGALDLLAPPRRAEDLLPPTRRAGAPASRDMPRTYIGPGLPRASAHAEQLMADGVLDAVERHLIRHGALRSRPDERAGVADPLRRSLEAVFRSDALLAQMPALLSSGVWVWLPVKGFAGAAYYLWVRVTVARMDPAHGQRPRPEVKLTLRGERLHETEDGRSSRVTVLGGAAVVARGGTRSAESHEHGHGGAELRAGRLFSRESAVSNSTKTVDIYRLGTKDEHGSHEFEHNVSFRVETAMSYDPPEIVRVVADAIGTVTRGARQLTHRIADVATRPTGLLGDPAAAVLAGSSARPTLRSERTWWLWREVEHVEGRTRLLVPHHMTAADAVPEQGAASVAPFRRTFGQDPRWEPVDLRPHGLPPAFLENFHPGDVNAEAINRWTWLAAVRTVRPPDLTDHAVDERAGIDVPARAGLSHAHDMAYLHDTSHGAVRPRIVELLSREYEVHVGTEVVKVGFELRAAREFRPEQEIRNKTRRYQQVDTATESARSTSSGWFVSLGPEGGGGGADQAFIGRLPYERKVATGEKRTAGDSATHETNQEGTRQLRYFAFDVTLVAQVATSPRRALRVDVTDGLVGALPVENGRLVGDLEDSLGWLLRPQDEVRATVDAGARPIIWQASSHSDGQACVSVATVTLVPPTRSGYCSSADRSMSPSARQIQFHRW